LEYLAREKIDSAEGRLSEILENRDVMIRRGYATTCTNYMHMS